MKQRPRIYYTQSQIAQMWDRLQQGDSNRPLPAVSSYPSFFG